MHRNPFYDPNWRAALHAANECLEAARKEEAETAKAFASLAHRNAIVELETARLAVRRAQQAQFETVAAYAAWRFANLPAPRDGFALAHDTTSFETIEAVDAAYLRAERDALEGNLERRSRLPAGQPAGLAAFNAGEQNISSWRRFGEIDCMVTFCMAERAFHICLAHPWGALALKSNEIFRNIATQLTRESILLQIPEAAPVFEDEGHRLARHIVLIRQVNELAAKFHFYRHLLPERALLEEFCRVDMVWNGASWIDPDWSAVIYNRLPAVLRDAAGQPALAALPRGALRLAE